MTRRPAHYAAPKLFAFLLIFLSVFDARAGAQGTTPSAQATPATQTVKLRLLAYDGKGRTVADLKRENTHVYVDGVERPVTYFSLEQTPVSYGLVVDNSGSLAPQINAVIAAGGYVANSNGPSDEAFVVRFVASDQIKVMQDFTDDKAALVGAVRDMFIEGGQTALFDALYLSADHLLKKGRADAGGARRRALVLVTDGEDRASFYDSEQVLKLLRAGGVQVFAVGLSAGLDRNDGGRIRQSKRQRSMDLLEKLTSETGGRVFFAEKVGELKEAVEEIVKDLHTEYVVGFAQDAPDGRKHKVEVKAFGAKGTDKLKVVLRPEPAPEGKQKR
jgi:Ca-activated chloride channel family protein